VHFEINQYPKTKRTDSIMFSGTPEHCDTIARIFLRNIQIRREKALSMKLTLSDAMKRDIEEAMTNPDKKNEL